MAGVDHALATHDNLDLQKLFVTGSSYGGFMTNWVITQTKRFKAAVAGASLSNLISFYATSPYQDLVHAEFGGYPWAGRNFETLWKWSPLAHVAGVSTPTTFVHGEGGNDVHITQAEEMYTTLRHRGVPAELVGEAFIAGLEQCSLHTQRFDAAAASPDAFLGLSTLCLNGSLRCSYRPGPGLLRGLSTTTRP